VEKAKHTQYRTIHNQASYYIESLQNFSQDIQKEYGKLQGKGAFKLLLKELETKLGQTNHSMTSSTNFNPHTFSPMKGISNISIQDKSIYQRCCTTPDKEGNFSHFLVKLKDFVIAENLTQLQILIPEPSPPLVTIGFKRDRDRTDGREDSTEINSNAIEDAAMETSCTESGSCKDSLVLFQQQQATTVVDISSNASRKKLKRVVDKTTLEHQKSNIGEEDGYFNGETTIDDAKASGQDSSSADLSTPYNADDSGCLSEDGLPSDFHDINTAMVPRNEQTVVFKLSTFEECYAKNLFALYDFQSKINQRIYDRMRFEVKSLISKYKGGIIVSEKCPVICGEFDHNHNVASLLSCFDGKEKIQMVPILLSICKLFIFNYDLNIEVINHIYIYVVGCLKDQHYEQVNAKTLYQSSGSDSSQEHGFQGREQNLSPVYSESIRKSVQQKACIQLTTLGKILWNVIHEEIFTKDVLTDLMIDKTSGTLLTDALKRVADYITIETPFDFDDLKLFSDSLSNVTLNVKNVSFANEADRDEVVKYEGNQRSQRKIRINILQKTSSVDPNDPDPEITLRLRDCFKIKVKKPADSKETPCNVSSTVGVIKNEADQQLPQLPPKFYASYESPSKDRVNFASPPSKLSAATTTDFFSTPPQMEEDSSSVTKLNMDEFFEQFSNLESSLSDANGCLTISICKRQIPKTFDFKNKTLHEYDSYLKDSITYFVNLCSFISTSPYIISPEQRKEAFVNAIQDSLPILLRINLDEQTTQSLSNVIPGEGYCFYLCHYLMHLRYVYMSLLVFVYLYIFIHLDD
jgi:hypothetical protein